MAAQTTDDDAPEEYFPSPSQGYIVHALSGTRTNFVVGSGFEKQFWKVCDATLQGKVGHEDRTYFFRSPEEYQKAKGVSVSPALLKSWRARRSGKRFSCLGAHLCEFE